MISERNKRELLMELLLFCYYYMSFEWSIYEWEHISGILREYLLVYNEGGDDWL